MTTRSLRNTLLALAVSVGLSLGAIAVTAAPASAAKAKVAKTCPKGQHLDKSTGQCVGHAKKKH